MAARKSPRTTHAAYLRELREKVREAKEELREAEGELESAEDDEASPAVIAKAVERIEDLEEDLDNARDKYDREISRSSLSSGFFAGATTVPEEPMELSSFYWTLGLLGLATVGVAVYKSRKAAA